jgi:hypothetical protein
MTPSPYLQGDNDSDHGESAQLMSSLSPSSSLEWEYDPNKLSDPHTPLLSSITGAEYLTEMTITTRFYYPVSTTSEHSSLVAKCSKSGRKQSKKKSGVRQQVIHLHFAPFVPSIG